MTQQNQAQAIQAYVLLHVEQWPQSIVQKVMEHFNVSRTTGNRHVNTLVKKGMLIRTGSTKNVFYMLPDAAELRFQYVIDAHLDEFSVFRKDFSCHLANANPNLRDILSYVVTGLIQNAKSHSHGSKLEVFWKRDNRGHIITISDNGVGVFQKLAVFCNVDDPRETIFHLTKGKLTTDPANHTGEGLFFSSRVVDEFSIVANGLKFTMNNIENDWTIVSMPTSSKGTTIEIEISNNPGQNLVSVFKKFQKDDDLNFDVTEIRVELSKLGAERYVSRSQAKRIQVGLEGFDVIVLDFQNVRMVGQGFVDEMFRVYQNQFPNKKIQYIHANDDVLFMIKRGLPRLSS